MGWSCSGPVKYMNQQQLPKQWLEQRRGSWDGACSLRRSFSKFGRVLLPCPAAVAVDVELPLPLELRPPMTMPGVAPPASDRRHI